MRSAALNRDVPAADRLRRRRRRCVRIVAYVALGLAVYALNPSSGENFGVVAPGRVFRSSQPESNLRRLVATNRVASILNLRGGSRSDRFYVDEVRLARASGIDFYDFPMSASRRPTRRELLVLLDLFARCRYPLLIHCKSGSDRTGLACGLYLMACDGEPPDRARKALSMAYGHVPLLGRARLHDPFVEYDRWLEEHHLAHTPERLRSWVEHDYRSDDPETEFAPLEAGPRAELRARALR